MIVFPKTTEFNRRIPKEKFYSAGNFSSKDKNSFVNDIEKITWKNKISAQTTNFTEGKDVEEIEAISIALKQSKFDLNILNIIRKLIPYHILFVLEFEDEVKLAVYHTKLIQTEWMKKEDCSLEIKGLNLDAVWKNIIKSIDGGVWNDELSLDENIERKTKQAKLKKELEKLERQARNEKQPKKKFEIVSEIRWLEKQLEEIEE